MSDLDLVLEPFVPPDYRAYETLVLDTRTVEELAVQALQLLQDRLPDVVLREGLTEVVVVEVAATVIHEAITRLNLVPEQVTEVLLGLFDVPRDEGAPAVVDVEFTVVDDAGHTVPAATEVVLDLGSGQPLIVFSTNEALAVAAGQTSGTVAATALTVGAVANNTPASTALRLRTSVPLVSFADTATTVADGRDRETDAAWFARAIQRLDQLTEVLVQPHQFTAAALEDPAAARVRTVNLWDPDAGAGEPGDHPGHVTVAVMGDDGVALSAGAKTGLGESLSDRAAAHLAVHVIDATVTPVDITVTVARRANFTDAEVVDSVTQTLAAYLDTDTWEWGASVWRNELVSVIDQAPGVSRVAAVAVPADDVALPGVAPLAELGDLTVTVQAP